MTLEQARPGQASIIERKWFQVGDSRGRQAGGRRRTHWVRTPVVSPLSQWWGGEVRGQTGDTWSRSPAVLSLSYKHWRVRCFTFTSPSHSRPVSIDAGGKTVFWPGILFKLIPCPQSARPPGMFWLWLNNILCFSIKYCVACWLFAEIKNYSC